MSNRIDSLICAQERVIYNKEVQTTEMATDPIVIPVEELVQQRASREQQEAAKAAARDKELEEETDQLEKEIEEEIRGGTHSPNKAISNHLPTQSQSLRRKNGQVYLLHRSLSTSWSNPQKLYNELSVTAMTTFATIPLAQILDRKLMLCLLLSV